MGNLRRRETGEADGVVQCADDHLRFLPADIEKQARKICVNSVSGDAVAAGHLRQRPDFAFRSASRVGGRGIPRVPADSEVRIA